MIIFQNALTVSLKSTKYRPSCRRIIIFLPINTSTALNKTQVSSFWPYFGKHYNTTAWAITTQFFHVQCYLQARQNTQKVTDTHHITSKSA